jgi:hypothetical protein
MRQFRDNGAMANHLAVPTEMAGLCAINPGVIITRFIGWGTSFGNSTTHMAKLLPRLGGGSPVVVFGNGERAHAEG